MRIEGQWIELDGFVTAHSHAFQRMMRGRAQRPGPAEYDDFWSWRVAMYETALAFDPERMYQAARVAYAELRRRGYLTVGEFHYVHHDKDGTPYADRLAMSHAVIAAAKDVGLSIALLRAVYHRAGPGRPAESAQKRFSDPDLDPVLRDVDDLRSHYRDHPDVRVGIAPHSVRAVPPAWLAPIAAYAAEHALPVHMHVAEQPAEIATCLAETGKRPVEVVADAGLLSPRFVGVHATHLGDGEAHILGQAGAHVCLCPTTERDLGDGLPDVAAMVEAGVGLMTGIDSHVVVSPLDELRALEGNERLRTGKRIPFRERTGTPAEWLLEIGTHAGARGLGFDRATGKVRISRAHPDLLGVADDELLDAIVFSAGADVVQETLVEPRGG